MKSLKRALDIVNLTPLPVKSNDAEGAKSAIMKALADEFGRAHTAYVEKLGLEEQIKSRVEGCR